MNCGNLFIVLTKKYLTNLAAFDILLKYNLDILKKEQIFHLEYNKDGTPKTLDELLANITSENEQIITEIIKNRYQYNFAKDSNKNIK